jgi:cell division protein FtsW
MIPVMILIMAALIRHKTSDGTVVADKTKTENKHRLLVRVDTWINRVETFIYGGKENNDDNNYQVNQAKIAIAKGGFIGLGPGNSQQRNFLPHPYSDFIYAIIIEEYGLVGGAFIVFIYLVFLFRSIRIFKKCPFAFGAFLALGLSFTLMIQALANMAVNEFISGNRCNTSVGEHGRKFIFIYMPCHWNYIKRCKKCRTN